MRIWNFAALTLLAVPAPAACSCFAGDTLISTPDGPRRIDELAEGDRVYSFCHTTRRRVTSHVRRVFRHENARIGRLKGPFGQLAITAEHPVFDAKRARYVAASSLDPDAELLVLSGAAVDPMRSPMFHLTKERATVFNIEVETFQNYFAAGVLVHNKSYGDCCSYDGAGGLGGDAPGSGNTSGAGTSGSAGEGGAAGEGGEGGSHG